LLREEYSKLEMEEGLYLAFSREISERLAHVGDKWPKNMPADKKPWLRPFEFIKLGEQAG
jgi:hypothetical protein